jgi:MinD-like ATPase involved in chromosome partitioning or flagellar assembly
VSSEFPLRLALALGDQELEQRLRPAIDLDDELVVATNCLAADQLLQAVESRAVDAIVVAWGLHRLSQAVLADLERARLPLVLLTPDTVGEVVQTRSAAVLPLEVDAATLREAIKTAARPDRVVQPRPRPAPEPPTSTTPKPVSAEGVCVLAVAGGSGSPGRTTVAINLAAALGAVAPTVLVDADCASPCVAAYLNRDPSRNVCTLAHAVREDPHSWAAALEQELQPLHEVSPAAVALCGLPKRELRPTLTPGMMERLVAELARRYRYVVLDVGAELLGMDAPAIAHRAALAAAQHVLLVVASDLVSLWHGRIALGQLERHLSISGDQVSLVINRHDPRYHHPPRDIEWHLAAPAALVIPHDYAALQRAMADNYPVVADSASRAGRAVLTLAERIHHGRVRMPVPHTETRPGAGVRVALPSALAGALRWGSSS